MNYYRPLRIKQPPTIDDNLNEECWKDAKIVEGFKIRQREDGQQTTVMICYDENALYFGIVCFEENIDKLVQQFTERDDSVWTDDCIEIFIAPDYLKKKDYFHFVFNTIGTRFDQKVEEMGGNRTDWDGEWEVAVKILENKWIAEVAIPFSTSGLKVKDINLLGVSVCRERFAGPTEYSVWPIGGNFHRPGGHVLFTGYKEYLEKEILPEWEENKRQIYKLITPDIKKEQKEQIQGLINSIDNEIKKMEENEITTGDINIFIEKLENIYPEISRIKKDIEFTVFLNRLEKLTEAQIEF